MANFDQAKKEFDIDKFMATLTKDQQELISYFMFNSIQKGRIIGKMEMDGKSSEDIAKAVNAPEPSVRHIMSIDPFEGTVN